MRPSNFARLCAALVLATTAACDGGKNDKAQPAPATEPSEPAAEAPRASISAQSHMRDHYAAALAAQAAVIRGDLESVRREAGWVAEHPVPESVASWEPAAIRKWEQDSQPMRDDARVLAGAFSMEDAAMAVARMGVSCGGCHEKMKVVPEFQVPSRPGDASGAPARMLLHAWAADRMWEGLIGPSDASWQLGVEALAIAPLAEDEILTGATAIPEIVQRAAKVREHAAKASTSAPPAVRAEIYGQFLANCAGCHQRLGVGTQER